MWGLDALLPIINTAFLKLDVYSAFAAPSNVDGVDEFSERWGAIPVGTKLKLSIVEVGLEYQHFKNYFQPGHFNANYDMERAKFFNNKYVTKEELVWSTEYGTRNGIHGFLNVDLGGFVEVGGSYTHLFVDKPSLEDDRSYTAKAKLGKDLVTMIPKINSLEFFYEKLRIGYGLNDEGKADSFVDVSTNSTYGYLAGLEVSEGLTVKVGSVTSFYYDEDKGLVAESNFVAETVLNF